MKKGLGNKAANGALALAGAAAALLFLVASFILAVQIDIDYFDSFNFIMQTRRLFDAELYRAVAYDTSRPRMLVILLSLWHAPVKWISGTFPGITAIHVFMVMVTAGFLAAWTYLAQVVFGRLTAALLLLLLVVQPLLLHYSYPAMTDILSGLFLAVYLLVLRKVVLDPEQKHSALWLGAAGGALALTKHHLVPVLPATLVLLALLPVRKKLRAGWYFSALLMYCLIVDLATRVFGKWGEGLGPHYKHIVKQALAAQAEPTTPWIYLDALTRWGMSYPWFIALFCVGLAFPFLRKEIQARPYAEKIFLFAATLTTVACATLTQATPHREVRYMLPFLPAILLPVAWSVARMLEGLPRRRQSWLDLVGVILFFGALYFPLKGSLHEFQRFRAEPVYHSEISGEKAYWQGAASMGCQRMFACDYAFQSPRPWEIPADDYYRKHDLGPHYMFYLGVGAHYGPCPSSLLRDYGELARFWTPVPEMGFCYAMPIPMVGGKTAMLVQTKCKLNRRSDSISCADKRVFPFVTQIGP